MESHVPHTILPKSLPIEILHEIFVRLSRNDIEQIQLVCKSWNDYIQTSAAILPLRLLRNILLPGDEDKNFKILIFNQGCEGKYEVDLRHGCKRNEFIMKTLSSCIFTSLYANADTFDEETGHLNIMKMIVKLGEHKIQVIDFELILFYQCAWTSNISYMLSDLISAQNLKINQSIFGYRTPHPALMPAKFPRSIQKIDISLNITPQTLDENRMILEYVVQFVRGTYNSHFYENQIQSYEIEPPLLIHNPHETHKLCKKFIIELMNVYEECKHPEKLIQNFRINLADPLYKTLKKYLKKNKIRYVKSEKYIMHDMPVLVMTKTYEIKINCSWILKVELNRINLQACCDYEKQIKNYNIHFTVCKL